jgi:ribonuclease J
MKQKEIEIKGQSVKVIPLGGLNEIGKNITVIEYKNEILIVDCGLSFPEDEMLGIDIVIPDFTYLSRNKEKIKGMIITHGHEDHIGAIPYFLREFNVPIYGTKLTLGLIGNKLKEHMLTGNLITITADEKFTVGSFTIEAIKTTHSIADSVCFAIDTPCGMIFHTGDFKIDFTPIHAQRMDLNRLAEIGSKGVLLMLADSTNSERKGYTASEKTVAFALENIFRETKDRIIIATFSSNVYRVQMIIDAAIQNGRKIAISGRSMLNVVNVAMELGYLNIPENVLVDINKAKHLKNEELVIITTGSQGEPMSALSRMASGDHKAIQIKSGDMVILSSSPIPGNEKTISNILNKLFEKGAKVIYSDIADIHVSGHACEEELKLMHSLIKPKYFVPVHGEYRHLRQHSLIAEDMGMSKDNIIIMKTGQILNIQDNKLSILKETVPSGNVMVDGLGVGDVGNIVLRDRKLLSESGLIIVVAAIERSTGTICSGPDIISRGFVYVRESEDLIESARKITKIKLDQCMEDGIRDWSALKNAVKDELKSYIYEKTKRNPVILPIFLEV